MSMNSGDPILNSRRTLAAIVFTDVVSFSSRMQQDEEKTLRLVTRDMDMFRNLCEQSEGRVLKGTGDGLLVYFDSAVQAVGFAMHAQEAIRVTSLSLDNKDVLEHRIGIHLGDVFVSNDDVMGDGVNIASRLQAEAPAGGICISQTVYDVVKNRLDLRITPLGPRELKNIQEAMPVYQILLEAAGEGQGTRTDRPGKKSKYRIGAAFSLVGGKWIAAALCGALLLGTGVLLTAVLWKTFHPGASGPAPFADLKRPGLLDNSPSLAQPTIVVQQPLPATRQEPPKPVGPTVEEIAAAKAKYLRNLDFTGLVRWLKENQLGDADTFGQFDSLDSYRKLVRTLAMLAKPDAPIVAHAIGGRVLAWGEGSMIRYQYKGAAATQQFKSIPTPVIVALFHAIAGNFAQREKASFFENQCRQAGLLRE